MSKLTLAAGVGPKRYNSLTLRLENKLPKTIVATLKFLEGVYVEQYAEVHRIWTLPTMSEEVWASYITLFDDTEFHEISILKAARKVLKQTYVNHFKKRKVMKP